MGLRQLVSQRRPSLRAMLLGSFFFLFGITIIGIGIGSYKITESQFLVKRTKENLCSQTTHIANFFSYDLKREAISRGSNLAELGRKKQLAPETGTSNASGCEASSISPTPLPPEPDPIPGTVVDPIFESVGKRFSAILPKSVSSTSTGIRILDSNGTVISSTNKDKDLSQLGLSFANRQEVQEALTGRPVWNLRKKKRKSGREYIHYWDFFDLSQSIQILQILP